ncbi:hypothetical protein [Streptomyces sp. NPDC047071]|uniref:hypothetical protein n=1 Tax=Streptomyces sp. NPDC047071 TaxID=3154808 RepID=UPI0034532546
MFLSISVGLLLLIIAVVLLRSGGMKASHAVVCGLLGFYLAGTSVAPTIHDGLTATADIVSGIRP